MKRSLLFSLILIMITLSSFAETIRKDPLKKGDKFKDVNIVLNERAQYIENLEKRIEAMENLVSVPKGAVLAFNLATCPIGWEEIDDVKGRTIVGAGLGSGLTRRGLGAMGGSETIQLSINELPQHNHPEAIHSCSGHGGKWGYYRAHIYENCAEVSTKEIGESEPFSMMQPYIALLYCQKK